MESEFMAKFTTLQKEIDHVRAKLKATGAELKAAREASEARVSELEHRHQTRIARLEEEGGELDIRVAKNTATINGILRRSLLEYAKKRLLSKYGIPEEVTRPNYYTNLEDQTPKAAVIAAANAIWSKMNEDDRNKLSMDEVIMLVDCDPLAWPTRDSPSTLQFAMECAAAFSESDSDVSDPIF